MSKLFKCPCGRKWVVYIGNGKLGSLCCNLPLSPVDDSPMPPEKLNIEQAIELLKKEEGDDTIH